VVVNWHGLNMARLGSGCKKLPVYNKQVEPAFAGSTVSEEPTNKQINAPAQRGVKPVG
jgi:hypothetical protein